MNLVIRRWAAWAPGLEQPDDWERWRGAPRPLECDGRPSLHFLPPLFRRRCSGLSRLMLHIAYATCEREATSMLPAVFASRYGDLTLTVSLLESLARDESLTAAGFTHSVHNAQVGLFSVAAKNRNMASAVSGGGDTFILGVLEAVAMMHRAGGGAALLVVGDEPLVEVFKTFRGEPNAAYAVGLVLAHEGAGIEVALDAAPPGTSPSCALWPQAVEFLRWLLSDDRSLALGVHRSWMWTRR